MINLLKRVIFNRDIAKILSDKTTNYFEPYNTDFYASTKLFGENFYVSQFTMEIISDDNELNSIKYEFKAKLSNEILNLLENNIEHSYFYNRTNSFETYGDSQEPTISKFYEYNSNLKVESYFFPGYYILIVMILLFILIGMILIIIYIKKIKIKGNKNE